MFQNNPSAFQNVAASYDIVQVDGSHHSISGLCCDVQRLIVLEDARFATIEQFCTTQPPKFDKIGTLFWHIQVSFLSEPEAYP